MKMLRFAIVGLLTASMSGAPAFAGELRDSIAAAAVNAAATQETPMVAKSGGKKAATLAGSALFVGGMTAGLFGLINNVNGDNSEFGEADATSPKLAAMGLGTAFAGGLLMLMGRSAKVMPSVTFGKKGVGVAKRITW